jgi:hypothetical protein
VTVAVEFPRSRSDLPLRLGTCAVESTGVIACATGAGLSVVRRHGLPVFQSAPHPPEACVLEWHRRLDVYAPAAPRAQVLRHARRQAAPSLKRRCLVSSSCAPPSSKLWACNGRPARWRTASLSVGSHCTVAAGSDTAKAIEHVFKRWPALQRYASSGSLPIGKNPVKNVVRAIAIGKKNWLFACAKPASYRAAAIQSLFATAELNGINPAYWLAGTLNKLLTCPNSQVDSLLAFATLHSPKLRWKVERLAAYRSNV